MFLLVFVGRDAMSVIFLLVLVGQDVLSAIFLFAFVGQDAQSVPRFVLDNWPSFFSSIFENRKPLLLHFLEE